MEDSKKIVSGLLILIALLVSGCGQENQKKEAISPADDKSNTFKIPVYFPLGNKIYKDSTGRIFLKVKNGEALHPSLIGRPRPDSIFLEEVWVENKNSFVSLEKVLDLLTFRQINDRGTYFRDSKYIYVYMAKPHAVQFFTLDRNGERFLSSTKDYLLHQGTLYWWGIKVEGLNNKKLSIIKYYKNNDKGFYEFISDEKVLYYGLYSLDKERLAPGVRKVVASLK